MVRATPSVGNLFSAIFSSSSCSTLSTCYYTAHASLQFFIHHNLRRIAEDEKLAKEKYIQHFNCCAICAMFSTIRRNLTINNEIDKVRLALNLKSIALLAT